MTATLPDQAQALEAVIRKTREILAAPERWTRGTLARTLLREPAWPLSDGAWSWSVSGALAVAIYEVLGPLAAQCDRQRVYDQAIEAIWSSLPQDHPRTTRMSLDIDGFNDYVGVDHRDIIELLCRAARRAHNSR